MAHKMHEEKSDQTIKKAFEVFDADKSGFIDSNELRRILANLGEAVTSQQVSAMISKVDENGDGNIDYEEFAKARRRAAPRRACAPRRLTARAPNAGARRRGVDALRRKEEGRRQVRGQ